MINGILSPTGDVFYLDLTNSFDTTDVPYVSKVASPFLCAWCQSAIGGSNQSKIFFFAGAMVKQETPNTLTDSIIYSFDIKTQTWSPAPPMTGMIYTRRREFQPVSDNNGKIYLFGGGSDMLLGLPTVQVYNTMDIFDSIAYSWTLGSLIDPPFSKIDYTASLLPNGNIVYIGGTQSDVNTIQLDPINMNKIDIYDTVGNSWSSMIATGPPITQRTGHTAVLNNKGEIIIFGGMYVPTMVASQPQIAVLNTATNPFQWTIPTVNSNEISPPSLVFHTATLFENYMIVAFGNVTRDNIDVMPVMPGQSDQLYVLDTNTFTWVRIYNPPSNSNNNNTTGNQVPQPNNAMDKIMIITIVVITFVVIVGVIAGVIIYRRKIKKSDDDITINVQPYVMNQQTLASPIDSESIYSSSTSNNVPVTSKNIHQFNEEIKHQYITIPSSSSETSSVNYHSDANITRGDDNTARQYVDNNTRHYMGGNNMGHQHYQYVNMGDMATTNYISDANIAPTRERFNSPPNQPYQPYRAVMMNTRSGEMYVPPNGRTTSNNNNFSNPNDRFSRQ
ncbi:hypothetical protein GLOIN_2v67585 [Rhizophagus clarus]|nr:hypothetical protein GLOIN_2v67585 [Rhizophagus clarus]